jgi:hypothetical protein
MELNMNIDSSTMRATAWAIGSRVIDIDGRIGEVRSSADRVVLVRYDDGETDWLNVGHLRPYEEGANHDG